MTHYEMFQTVRSIRENLGKRGHFSIEADLHEGGDGRIYIQWTIAFFERIGSFGTGQHVQVSSVESADLAILQFEEAMRQAFASPASFPESELPALLDSHLAIEAGVGTEHAQA